jgi:signal transduction histidine kinase
MFKVIKKEGRARRGEFRCAHGGTVQIERSGADGTVMLVTLPRDGKES